MITAFGDPDDNSPGWTRADWARAGVPVDEIEAWEGWHVDPPSAGAWSRAGVTDPLEATRWEAAGVTPGTVEDWVDEGIDVSEALRWHDFGFDLDAAKDERAQGRGPDDAFNARHGSGLGASGRSPMGTTIATGRSHMIFAVGPSGSLSGQQPDPVQRFMQSGGDMQLLHEYLRHQWTDEDAIAWARWGITAGEAYLFHDLGLTAADVGPLLADGRTAGELIRRWWQTGIPFDEVAEWLGAGLSPDEAVEQRGQGVTAEQAAAMRALRHEDAEPPRTRGPDILWQRLGPPTTEPLGPPPDDPEAARRAIEQLFAAMLTTYDDAGGLALVEGGGNLGPSIREARERVGASDVDPVVTVTVAGVRFLDAATARVAYDLQVRGRFGTNLGNRLGRAVLVEGEWLASRETVTELLTMAGVACPPPDP